MPSLKRGSSSAGTDENTRCFISIGTVHIEKRDWINASVVACEYSLCAQARPIPLPSC